jgi:phospholipid-translocating ATPase
VNPKTGKLEYKAQSPDEAALVSAAADVGYVFKGRDREILSLQKPVKSPNGEEGTTVEQYELLNILDFTSARKRMSVVVRRLDSDDNRLFLLSKGADSVIFERLKKGSDEILRSMTEMHLSEFAGEGLRTLTLAYKVIPGEAYTMASYK